MEYNYFLVYNFFKTTTEYFDSIEINPDGIDIVYRNQIIEHYSNDDIIELIPNYNSSRH